MPKNELLTGLVARLPDIETWGESEQAARAVHAAWVKGMQHQHRDVDRHRLKWTTLDPVDRDLDASIARDVIQALLASLLEPRPNDTGT